MAEKISFNQNTRKKSEDMNGNMRERIELFSA